MKSRRLISSPQPEDRAPYHTVVGNAPSCITTNLAAHVRDRSNSTELAEVTTSIYDRGRDASCLAPPAQIRTCPIRAYGSHLGCLTAKRASGQGWRMRGFGSQSSTNRTIRSIV